MGPDLSWFVWLMVGLILVANVFAGPCAGGTCP